jgi:hypothetical protein
MGHWEKWCCVGGGGVVVAWCGLGLGFICARVRACVRACVDVPFTTAERSARAFFVSRHCSGWKYFIFILLYFCCTLNLIFRRFLSRWHGAWFCFRGQNNTVGVVVKRTEQHWF